MENIKVNSDLPSILIVSSTIERSKELIENMSNKSSITSSPCGNYVLNINNKYYKAEILLHMADNFLINPSTFEALIFYYDIESESSLKFLNEQVYPFTQQTEAEIVLLVCNTICDTDLREKAIQWCAIKKLELIELLQPDSKEIADLEMDQSKYGIDRIIEALEAHMWSNMEMKGSCKNVHHEQSEIDTVEKRLENVDLANSEEFSERLRMESVLDGIMNNDNADFGELFSNLRAMKEHAASMPSNHRRLAAEQLVTAFWKAIGGDSSEVDIES